MFLVFIKVVFSLLFLAFSVIALYFMVTAKGFAERVSIFQRILAVLGLTILLLSSLSVLITTLFL